MSEYLPADLILEIILRLPSKSIARCRCLSKLWASTLGSPYFTELFLTQSKTRPRLLLAVRGTDNKWVLYSCPQPQILYNKYKSSISVTAKFHMFHPKPWTSEMSPPISGLLCFPCVYEHDSLMLCNPSTQHLFRLPCLPRVVRSFFGYDPIDKKFSVLAFNHLTLWYDSLPKSYQILKLGSGRLSWRSLNCSLHHYPSKTNICIDGILYYIASFETEYPCKLASFDLNSEEFKFVDVPWPQRSIALVNFKGKLGGINTNQIGFGEERFNLELSLWVLEDVEKQEWSKHVYYLPSSMWTTKHREIFVIGVTATGDVVLSLRYTTLNPLYVYFFNIDENILRKVEIKGFERFKFDSFINGHVDYVEDLKDLNWS